MPLRLSLASSSPLEDLCPQLLSEDDDTVDLDVEAARTFSLPPSSLRLL